MKENLTQLTEAARNFTLTLESISGGMTLFFAFINGVLIIQSDGTIKRTWAGKIPETQVRIKIRSDGIDEAFFKLAPDLKGTAEDPGLTFKLQGGYYETEISL